VIAHLPTGNAVPQSGHLTGSLQTQNLAGTLGRRIVALPLQQIRPIHAGGDDSDQDLSGARNRRVSLPNLEDLRTTRLRRDDRSHRLSVPHRPEDSRR
jgi:hypothetical protein